MRDPYALLGVRRSADNEEIKAAFRAKAKSVHPDRNHSDPGANGRFAEIGAAYEILKDPERRRRYDDSTRLQATYQEKREAAERARAAKANAEKVMEELARAEAERAGRPASPEPAARKTAGGESTETIFERIFGAAAASMFGGYETEEADVNADAARSGPKNASPSEPRRTAGGSQGATPGGQNQSQNASAPEPPMSDAYPDAAAAGGAISPAARDFFTALMRRLRGNTITPEKAPDIFAEAEVSLDDLLKLKTVNVSLADGRELRLPLEKGAGVGDSLRLKGQGLKLPGMKQGDVVVTLRLLSDSGFAVDGADIRRVLPISLEDAVLGAEATVTTPDGEQTVSIPPWSGSDREITLPGLGLHRADGERGDLVVELRIMLWEKPDEKVTDLMRHMRHGLFV